MLGHIAGRLVQKGAHVLLHNMISTNAVNAILGFGSGLEPAEKCLKLQALLAAAKPRYLVSSAPHELSSCLIPNRSFIRFIASGDSSLIACMKSIVANRFARSNSRGTGLDGSALL